jgi:tetratricopeptide (TPR) repeat protein
MSIESLKQQARKHEQNEDWKKALDQYNKALAELAREEQVDIGLYNRVGDLFVRVGDLDAAVEHYDKAVELYREAYLPNNAIAVCKKIIRNVPDRHRAYLLIGQIRAEQGFIPDARTNFLTYAERMQQAGDLDESFRALIEFCDLAPADVGVRVSVADQMLANSRETEAVEQLKIVRAHHLKLGDSTKADDIESRILNLDPQADLSSLGTVTSGDDFGLEVGFGEMSFGGAVDLSSGSDEEVSFAVSGGDAHAAPDEAPAESVAESETGDEVDAGLAGFEIESGGDDEDEPVELPMMQMADEDAVVELPMMEISGDEDADHALATMGFEVEGSDVAESAEPLPTMDFGDDDAGEAVELPMMDMDDDDSPELPTIDFAADAVESAMEEVAGEADSAASLPSFDLPESVLETPMEEISVESVDAPLVSAPIDSDTGMDFEVASGDFEAPVEDVPAPSVPEDTPTERVAPAKDDGGYVDFGAMILGDTQEKSTRFTVAYEEPSGDEEADFAKMLSQFKDKVSENLDSSDVRAHYDLGTAYKEMGLLDEAISSFQAALRASADHLPTYEIMGQTFMEMGQPEAAVKSLERALESASTVEDELVGIYYYLGRAYQELENRDSAVEYYDRVFSLDINFADVTERLRELR